MTKIEYEGRDYSFTKRGLLIFLVGTPLVSILLYLGSYYIFWHFIHVNVAGQTAWLLNWIYPDSFEIFLARDATGGWKYYFLVAGRGAIGFTHFCSGFQATAIFAGVILCTPHPTEPLGRYQVEYKDTPFEFEKARPNVWIRKIKSLTLSAVLFHVVNVIRMVIQLGLYKEGAAWADIHYSISAASSFIAAIIILLMHRWLPEFVFSIIFIGIKLKETIKGAEAREKSGGEGARGEPGKDKERDVPSDETKPEQVYRPGDPPGDAGTNEKGEKPKKGDNLEKPKKGENSHKAERTKKDEKVKKEETPREAGKDAKAESSSESPEEFHARAQAVPRDESYWQKYWRLYYLHFQKTRYDDPALARPLGLFINDEYYYPEIKTARGTRKAKTVPQNTPLLVQTKEGRLARSPYVVPCAGCGHPVSFQEAQFTHARGAYCPSCFLKIQHQPGHLQAFRRSRRTFLGASAVLYLLAFGLYAGIFAYLIYASVGFVSYEESVQIATVTGILAILGLVLGLAPRFLARRMSLFYIYQFISRKESASDNGAPDSSGKAGEKEGETPVP